MDNVRAYRLRPTNKNNLNNLKNLTNMICKECNHTNEGAGKFCAECGSAIEVKKIVVIVAMGLFSKLGNAIGKLDKLMSEDGNLEDSLLSADNVNEKINKLYSKKDYSTVIEIFEKDDNLKLNENEDAVDKYLWSLWLIGDNEKKCNDLAKEYNKKFDTERWDILRGHYSKWKKWYDNALSWYKDSSEKDYNEVKKIFEDFNNLEDNSEIIDYFEKEFNNLDGNDFISNRIMSISPNLCIKYLDALYSNDKYSRAITFVEELFENETYKEDEEIVNKYLWSLWNNNGTEEKSNELVKEYSKKFDTERWDILRGHYCKWKKWYDNALSWYEDSSEKNYNEVKKIFEDYNDLDDHSEIIDYYENKLYNVDADKDRIKDISPDLTYKYVNSLYRNSGTENKALEKWNEYSKDEDRWLKLGANIKRFVGRWELDINLIEEAIIIFEKFDDKDGVISAKESIKEVKIALKEREKQAAADAKREAAEAAAEAAAAAKAEAAARKPWKADQIGRELENVAGRFVRVYDSAGDHEVIYMDNDDWTVKNAVWFNKKVAIWVRNAGENSKQVRLYNSIGKYDFVVYNDNDNLNNKLGFYD